MSQVFGRHNLKYGFSYNYYQKTENAGGNNVGTFAFAPPAGVVQRGSSTYEQSWADFLVGRVSTFSDASKDITPDIRAQQWELYLQDDFRLRPNLTINLGVRYSMFRNPIDNNNQLSSFDPGSYFRSLAPAITAAGNLATPNTALPGVSSPTRTHLVEARFRASRLSISRLVLASHGIPSRRGRPPSAADTGSSMTQPRTVFTS